MSEEVVRRELVCRDCRMVYWVTAPPRVFAMFDPWRCHECQKKHDLKLAKEIKDS